MQIQLVQSDITKLEVDAIVNAANSSLMGGGGVDGAIHRAGGPQILEECRDIRNKQGKCEPGNAVITNAGKLPCKKVIHTVGPKWNGGESQEDQKLRSCYKKSLELAEAYGLATVAFPNIGTGIYGFPKARAADIAIKTVQNWKAQKVEKVLFVCFDEENYQLYSQLLENN